ncbi:uncharacterized protein TNCV_741081 [Trichonephila clavipes]|nr:uncharacterized protein TNCV_741081 [Trichonephila clavipes]
MNVKKKRTDEFTPQKKQIDNWKNEEQLSMESYERQESFEAMPGNFHSIGMSVGLKINEFKQMVNGKKEEHHQSRAAGKKELIEWCMKEGLIASSYECPKCNDQHDVTWSAIKRFLRNRASHAERMFDHYLAE